MPIIASASIFALPRSDLMDTFTETEYRQLIRRTAENYVVCGYADVPDAPHAILRHDLDASMHRALALARIEQREGVTATYFLFPRCLYYNLLHPECKAIVRQILEAGHRIGLHFDVSIDHMPSDLDRLLKHEKQLIEDEFGVSPEAVSFHLAGDFQARLPREQVVCGMTNAYSSAMSERYKYVSDSNGVWRFDRWSDLIDPSKYPRLHILTHPEWWTPEPMTPRQRLQRAIDGYASRMGRWYDETTRRFGRPNY